MKPNETNISLMETNLRMNKKYNIDLIKQCYFI